MSFNSYINKSQVRSFRVFQRPKYIIDREYIYARGLVNSPAKSDSYVCEIKSVSFNPKLNNFKNISFLQHSISEGCMMLIKGSDLNIDPENQYYIAKLNKCWKKIQAKDVELVKSEYSLNLAEERIRVRSFLFYVQI